MWGVGGYRGGDILSSVWFPYLLEIESTFQVTPVLNQDEGWAIFSICNRNSKNLARHFEQTFRQRGSTKPKVTHADLCILPRNMQMRTFKWALYVAIFVEVAPGIISIFLMLRNMSGAHYGQLSIPCSHRQCSI